MTDEVKRCVEALRFKEDFECIECPIPAGNCEENCMFDVAANLIESLSDKNKQLKYTLIGVMHFVDKWLDDIEPYSLVDDPSGQVAIDRAAEARRITLEHIDDLTREMYRRGQELSEVQRERDTAVEDIRKAAWCGCHVCKHYYRPDPDSVVYSCKKYGDFDKHDFIADDGSIFCGAMEWRGVKEGESDG